MALPLVFVLTVSLASASSSSTNVNTNTTSTATCYHLDGFEARDHVPCYAGSSDAGDAVNCCHEDDICMSNGLCLQQGTRGIVLSRGSCMDHDWGTGCYAPCSDYHRSGGIPIVNVGFDSDDPEYCCGAVTVNEDEEDGGDLSCEFGSPFTIPRGTAISGVAGLSDENQNHDSHDEDDDDDDDDAETENHEEEGEEDDEHTHERVSPGIAVALGVGIPLGLLVMGGILWAVWERRRRQLKIEEEDGHGQGQGHAMTAMKLRGLELHHRYGPIPSPVPTYSRRGTPTQSAVFYSVHAASPPTTPPRTGPGVAFEQQQQQQEEEEEEEERRLMEDNESHDGERERR
ncbi:uncharacterized protein BJX67DRAFT_383450 [Aspergillus lucknowensis]|uniref:Mid2 domain-containing protein n=1 Tax=Aspergillus lucknowensis TaxID=176173 RepID=A0ABR4LN30_9EURO